MKKIILIIFLIFLVLFLGSDIIFAKEKTSKADVTHYQEFHKELVSLFRAKKYEKAKVLLEKNVARFPEKLDKFAFNMAVIYQLTKEYNKGIAILKRALTEGFWFNIFTFKGDLFKDYKTRSEFAEIITMNDQLRTKTQKKAKPIQKLVLPKNFTRDKKYPLFIALHGGGENIEVFEPQWHSQKLKSEFIVLYLQSSQVISMTGFAWENKDITKKEILEAYRKIIEKYPVNINEVIIGGFSSGGFASLITVFENTIPVTGFIVLCPPVPENITVNEVVAAKNRNIRGTLLTTEMDRRIGKQKELAQLLKQGGLKHQFIVTPNIGHWYPKDLDKKIDQAIDHIRYK